MKISYEVRWGHPRTRKANGSHRREQRRIEAEARQSEYNAMTTQEKIACVMLHPGNSKRELAKLMQ